MDFAQDPTASPAVCGTCSIFVKQVKSPAVPGPCEIGFTEPMFLTLCLMLVNIHILCVDEVGVGRGGLGRQPRQFGGGGWKECLHCLCYDGAESPLDKETTGGGGGGLYRVVCTLQSHFLVAMFNGRPKHQQLECWM